MRRKHKQNNVIEIAEVDEIERTMRFVAINDKKAFCSWIRWCFLRVKMPLSPVQSEYIVSPSLFAYSYLGIRISDTIPPSLLWSFAFKDDEGGNSLAICSSLNALNNRNPLSVTILLNERLFLLY
jgi:hypothetical protein